MRAFPAVSPHRVLLVLALLAPVAPLLALLRSSWVESAAARHARATLELTRAGEEVAALTRIDQLVLDRLRRRPLPASAQGATRPAWLSPEALPREARRAGGIVAVFLTDPAGMIWPAAPAVSPTLQDAGFFRRLQRGAALALGPACPVAPREGFVLAAPLAPPAGAAASIGFRGAIGVCILPRALERAWHRRLHPGESLVLADAEGGRLLQVMRRAPPGDTADDLSADDRPAASPADSPSAAAPPATNALAAGVAGTPFRVAFTPAPLEAWRAWTPGVLRDSLLAFTLLLGLGLAAATRAARYRQDRTSQALAGAERFADVLRLSAERYRQIYLGAPAAMHALDSSRRIVAVNDRWLALLGYRREEVLGRRFDVFLAPAARPAAEQDWARLLAGDQLAPARRRLLRPDGSVVDLVVTETAERESDGRLRRACSVLLEPAAPAEREPARPDLLARVAGGVAHDFNNLLMVVMGSLERLAAQPESADRVRRLAGMALAAAERGAGLTQRLLAAAGRQALRPELVNANRLLREASDAIVQAAGPKVEVQLVLSPVLDPARLDPAQFRTALLALVSNAREAMPRGGRLTIETTNLAGSTPQQGRICVSLSDTGTGMDPTVLARATEPFFTTRGPGRASGLGLSMAAGFARQSGGSLEIESETGVGSTVRLLLPRSADAAPPAEDPHTGPDPSADATRPEGESAASLRRTRDLGRTGE